MTDNTRPVLRDLLKLLEPNHVCSECLDDLYGMDVALEPDHLTHTLVDGECAVCGTLTNNVARW